MKILFLTSGSVRSNFTYRALSLARELQKLGHEPVLVCPKADKYNGFIAEDVKELDGVRVIQPKQFVTKKAEVNLLPYIFDALLAVIREKPDLVYIYKPTPISIVGLTAKFLRKTPVVLDMDDLGAEVMKAEGFPIFQQQLIRWSESFAERFSDRIVVASTYLLEKYGNRYPGKPLYLMPNGADESWIIPPEMSGAEKRIVFMGALGRKSILDPLFDALPDIIERHPDTEALVIGDGKYLDHYKIKAQELGIDRNVTFTGWLKIEDARAKLRCGDLGYCFMPDDVSTRAASNMKIPQYLIRGVVPLVSAVGDLPRSVGNGRFGYIAKDDKSLGIREILLQGLEDPERKTIKAKLAREFALDNLTWHKLASGFAAWLDGSERAVIPDMSKVFLVASSVPGDFGGSEIRNLNLARQFVLKGKKVHIFCVFDESEQDRVEKLKGEEGITVTTLYKKKSSLLTKLRSLLNRMQPFMDEYQFSGLGSAVSDAAKEEAPGYVQLEQIEAYHMLLPHISALRHQGAKIILDAHNVEAEAFRGAIESFPEAKRFIGKLLLGKLTRMEIEAAKEADLVLACSEKDAAYFRRYNTNVYVVANGVDTGYFRAQEMKKGGRELIFIGGTKYAPNADAIRFYLSKIHPQIRQSFPETRLIAIGATEDFLKKNELPSAAVSALGFVEDIRPYLDRAMVGICPIRQGSGTRLKVLTFMSSGLPVVATSKGAEGIDYEDGRNILIADDEDEFAEAIISLMGDEDLRIRIGAEARELMIREYDWNVIGERLAEAYGKLAK